MSAIITKFSKDDIVEMSGVMSVMERKFHNIKSVEGLIEEIKNRKGFLITTSPKRVSDSYDEAIEDVLNIIKEYCEVSANADND